MAKTQTAHVVITANAKAAVEVMKMLKEKTDEYIARLDQLKQKKQQGIQLTKDEEKEAKQLEQKIRALTTAQQRNEAEYRKTRDVMKNIAGSTTKDLKRAYAELAKMLNNTTGEQTKRQEILRRKMQEVQAQIQKNTGVVKAHGSAWSTTVKNIVAYVGVFGVFNQIKNALTSLVSQNKALSDSMANIRKVSQWASKDVVALTENLAKIDTRNSITTLQNLAYQGAKLGIGQYGVEGLTGFVRAAEQVQTALGEDLGEEALPALAKLTEVMGLIPKFGVEEAMQKAGSVIYQLSATSTATGKNIVEFSKRLMGLANVSGVSADQLLGLGAAADTMALMPEVAATAFNKLFNSIHANTEGIAKAVGLAKKELTDLLYEGRTMDALVKVFEKMQNMSMAEMEGRGVFKELGSDGARLTNVMITMANKVDMLKKSLETSNEAFSEGKAVINEYMIQQETAAAYFERASNIWTKSFVNPEGVDIVKQLAQEWYNVSYEMTHSVSTMTQIRLTLGLIAQTAMTLIKILPTLVQLMMFYGVGKIIQGIVLQFRAWNLAATMTGTAMSRLNVLIKANAIALFISGLAAAGMKLYELMEASKAAAAEEEKRQRVFSDAAAEAMQAYNEQKKSLDKYDEALKKSNSTEEERNDLVKQFKSEFGSYLEKLGIEINTYDDMAAALKRVNKELKDKAFYETGQKLKASYVGDAKQEQTNALSQYMQLASAKGLSTDVMQQIVEGKAGTRKQSIVAAFGSMNNGQMLGKLYSQLSSGGISYNALSDDVRQFVKQQYGSGVSISKVWDSLKDVATAAGNLYDTSQEVIKRNEQVDKFIKDNADKYSPNINVDAAILNLKKLKKLNEEKLNEGLNVLREEWKNMSETNRNTDRGKQISSAIDQYGKQIRALRGEGYTPPPTAKELAKAQREAKAARLEKLRSDFKQSKEDAEGLIAKIDEWYNLQEAAVKDAESMGQMTQTEADKLVKTMEVARNESLMRARKAVGSGEQQAVDDWQNWANTVLPVMLADSSKWSVGLMEDIQKVDAKALHDFLKKFNGSKAMAKLDASSFLDTIMKKGAESGKKAAVLRAQFNEELTKLLDQFHPVDVALRKMREDLNTVGIITETYEQQAARLAAGVESPDEWRNRAQQAMESRFKGNYGVDGEKPEDMQKWFMEFTDNGQAEWSKALPMLQRWVQDTDRYKTQINNLYDLLKLKERGQATGDTKVVQSASQQINSAVGNAVTEQQAYMQAGFKFMGQGTLPYTIDITNQQEALQWLRQFATDANGELEQWAAAFPQIADMVQRIKAAEKDGTIGEDELTALQDAMPQIEAIYMKLLNYSDQVGKNIEQQVNAMMPQRTPIGTDEMRLQYEQRRDLTTSFYQKQIDQANAQGGPVDENGDNAAAIELKRQRDQELIDMEYQHQQQLWQIREQMGVTWQDEYENELARYKNMLDKKLISEKEFQKKKGQLQVQQGLKYGQYYNGLMSDMVNALQDYEIAAIEAKYDAQIKAARENGQDTAALEEEKEREIMETRKKYAALQMAVKISEIIMNTAAGIMMAFASLPTPAAIAATTLISATGAAQLALAKAEYDKVMNASVSSSKSSSSAKTKLTSGMLTYDEGNVQSVAASRQQNRYLGDDGRVYSASNVDSLPAGVSLVRRPIATTVNGHNALVAERGPEIVIGRRATRHIQMNEPGLLRHLATINGRYRTHDEGNLGSEELVDTQTSATDDRVAAALEQNTQVMLAMIEQLKKPVHINMYGTDGLYERSKQATEFMRRYNG